MQARFDFFKLMLIKYIDGLILKNMRNHLQNILEYPQNIRCLLIIKGILNLFNNLFSREVTLCYGGRKRYFLGCFLRGLILFFLKILLINLLSLCFFVRWPVCQPLKNINKMYMYRNVNFSTVI